METISLREYARRREVSDTAVRKAITAGKIVQGRVFDKGVPRIIESVANQEWDQYESRKERTPRPTPTPAPEPVKSAKPHAQTPATVAEYSSEPPKPAAGTLAAARLIQAQLKAKMMETELKEKLGKLIEKDKVYAALFSAGKELRVNLMAIPDRYIDDILAAGSRNEAHTVLTNALADILESIADASKIDLSK